MHMIQYIQALDQRGTMAVDREMEREVERDRESD